MGLDSVELVLEIEKAFAIKIPDQEAEKILTVGDFHNSVWRHLADRHTNKCHSQSLFYKLRNSLSDQFGIPKQAFTMDSSLNDMFPKNERRKNYLAFAQKNDLQLPSLVLPERMNKVFTMFGFVTIVGTLLLTSVLTIFFSYSAWILLLIIGAILITILVSYFLNPWRTIVSPNTMKEFTGKTLVLNFETFSKYEGTNRKEMEAVMNQIIADKAGLDLSEVTSDKKICDDLGLN